MNVYYNIHSKDEEKAFESLCSDFSVMTKRLSPAYLKLTVLQIIKGDEPARQDPLALMPEFLLFHFPSGDSLPEFLSAYRARGLRRIPLKAVVTEHNMSWTLAELLKELREEDRMINRKK